MKEKKFEYNELIGFIIISIILYLFLNSDESINNKIKNKDIDQKKIVLNNNFNIKKNFFNNKKFKETTLENNLFKINISNEGGFFRKIILKNYKNFNNNKKLYIINNNNFLFGFVFKNNKGDKIFTNKLFFNPKLEKYKSNFYKLTMKSSLSEKEYIKFIYIIDKKNYNVKFNVFTKGLNNKGHLFWIQKISSFEKDKNWEKNYTQIYYSTNKDNNVEYLNDSGNDVKKLKNVNWISAKQQFFTSILSSNKLLNNVKIISSSLENNNNNEIKKIQVYIPIYNKDKKGFFSGNWYFGPINYSLLKEYNKKFEDIIPFGWGILRWINTYFFLSIFDFLNKTNLNCGIIIILMTLVVKLILSPINYKQYKLSAMMKIINPDIDYINNKFKDSNPLKKQQMIMELYRKTGVNPMSGCLPAFLQIPIFYSLFKFFPTIIALRGEKFLWADDLTSYDSIFKIPFYIPIYGDHVSLFTILYAMALFLYNKFSINNISSQQGALQNTKIMMYFVPITMLLFINNYASGLSLYYFISNIVNVALIFIIKKFFLNEKKIREKIQKNKNKPIKESNWQKRINKIIEISKK